MGASETLNNEVTDTLGYLIDKFNLTFEVLTNQIKEFSEQMATKIITWELVESIIYLVIYLAIISIIFIILKHFKIKSFKVLKEMYNSVDDYKTAEEKLVLDETFKHAAVRISGYIIVFMLTMWIIAELKDIILCITFPEKIILEFISRYI